MEGLHIPQYSNTIAYVFTLLYCCRKIYGCFNIYFLLSDFTFTFHFHTLEKEMATHSSVLAWRIPGKVEPDGLSSLESHRFGHD